ncbi:MAG: hypothetical protein KC910_21620 [Candidatus Eremiobacteraeota bacterium]|nr:hypothetical protein [Candidatus Eremiobacteraeota bacterium]
MTGKSQRLSSIVALVALILLGFTLTPLQGQATSMDGESAQWSSFDFEPGLLVITTADATVLPEANLTDERIPEASPRKSQTATGHRRRGRAPPRPC